jgi:hypothetical protein
MVNAGEEVLRVRHGMAKVVWRFIQHLTGQSMRTQHGHEL